MKIVIKERKMSQGTRVAIDVIVLAGEKCEKTEGELFGELAQIFHDAYKEDVLVTTDYFALCDIVIKQAPTVSYKRSCDLQMTADRVVMKLSGKTEKYVKRIEECFRRFYEERT